ncbi:unnamed protein product, partial [Protopolystoma xenopodis]
NSVKSRNSKEPLNSTKVSSLPKPVESNYKRYEGNGISASRQTHDATGNDKLSTSPVPQDTVLAPGLPACPTQSGSNVQSPTLAKSGFRQADEAPGQNGSSLVASGRRIARDSLVARLEHRLAVLGEQDNPNRGIVNNEWQEEKEEEEADLTTLREAPSVRTEASLPLEQTELLADERSITGQLELGRQPSVPGLRRQAVIRPIAIRPRIRSQPVHRSPEETAHWLIQGLGELKMNAG